MEEITAGAVQEAEPTETQEEKSTYTKEEVEALLQQEADRRVNEAMKRAQRQKEAAIKEAEKLAAMDAEEKAKYALEQKELELAEREERLAVAEHTAEAVKALADKNLSVGLVDLVVASDTDTMTERISLLEKEFKASVKAEVEKRLASTTPRRTQSHETGVDKAAFNRMTVSQQNELYATNPELYKQLTTN